MNTSNSRSDSPMRIYFDEVRAHKFRKLYEEYYKPYNKLIRPVQERARERTVEGLIRWTENKK